MSVCRSCHAPIIWTLTEAGKPMPVDSVPHEEGTVELTGRMPFADSTRLSRVLSGAALAAAREARVPLHRSHFVTCRDAAMWRRPQQREGITT